MRKEKHSIEEKERSFYSKRQRSCLAANETCPIQSHGLRGANLTPRIPYTREQECEGRLKVEAGSFGLLKGYICLEFVKEVCFSR